MFIKSVIKWTLMTLQDLLNRPSLGPSVLGKPRATCQPPLYNKNCLSLHLNAYLCGIRRIVLSDCTAAAGLCSTMASCLCIEGKVMKSYPRKDHMLLLQKWNAKLNLVPVPSVLHQRSTPKLVVTYKRKKSRERRRKERKKFISYTKIQHILPAKSLGLLPKCGVHGEEKDVLGPQWLPPLRANGLTSEVPNYFGGRVHQDLLSSYRAAQTLPGQWAMLPGRAHAQVSTGGFLPHHGF